MVAHVVAPGAAHIVSSIAGYDPQTFGPKDAERLRRLDLKGALSGLSVVSADVFPFLLGRAVRLAIVSPGPSRRR